MFILITRPRCGLWLWPALWRKVSRGRPHLTSGEPGCTWVREEYPYRLLEVSCVSSRSLLPIHWLSFLESARTHGRLFYTWDFSLIKPSVLVAPAAPLWQQGALPSECPCDVPLWCAPWLWGLSISSFLPGAARGFRLIWSIPCPRPGLSCFFKFLFLENGIRGQDMSSVLFLLVCHCFYGRGRNNKPLSS